MLGFKSFIKMCVFWVLQQTTCLHKNSCVRKNLDWGKPVGDQTLKCSGKAGSKGRAPLFLMTKQNLNPFYWWIWRTKNCKTWNRIDKVTAPQSRGSKTQKNKSLNATKACCSWTPQKLLVCWFVAIRVPRWFAKL